MKHPALPQLIGHRGACAFAPENTLLSMRKAAQLGFQWIECDVQLAACGEPVIIHDDTVDRTTNGVGTVHDLPYQTLKQLDAGNGTSIPTLSDLLTCLIDLKLGLNLELKPYPGEEASLVQTVCTELKHRWPSTCPPPLLSSFCMTTCEHIRAITPDTWLGLLFKNWLDTCLQEAKQHNATSLHFDHRYLEPDHIQTLKSEGYQVLAYTVNNLTRAKQLFEWGVDALFTDGQLSQHQSG